MDKVGSALKLVIVHQDDSASPLGATAGEGLDEEKRVESVFLKRDIRLEDDDVRGAPTAWRGRPTVNTVLFQETRVPQIRHDFTPFRFIDGLEVL